MVEGNYLVKFMDLPPPPPPGVIGVYQYEKEANFSKIFSHTCKEKTKFMIINVHEALCKNCEIHGRWDNGSHRGAITAIE